MSKNWIAVASAEHVRIGQQAGFMQVCHGKVAPLRRIQPGDGVLYYSPTTTFRGKEKLQAFTAIGMAKDREPYQVDMGENFCPFRRDVKWLKARNATIAPLLDELDFSAGKRNWGYQFRFGLFEISEHDLQIIATAMKVKVKA